MAYQTISILVTFHHWCHINSLSFSCVSLPMKPKTRFFGNWSSGYLGSNWLKKPSWLCDTGYSHVSTVGMRAANIRNNMEKKRKPELLRTFLASFPIPKYSKPIRSPIPMWDVTRRCVRTCQEGKLFLS